MMHKRRFLSLSAIGGLSLLAGGAALAEEAVSVRAAWPVDTPALGGGDNAVFCELFINPSDPATTAFFEECGDLIESGYLANKRIRLLMREVCLDRIGLWMALAARSGGATHHFALTRALSSNLEALSALAEDQRSLASEIIRICVDAGMDRDAVTAGITDKVLATGLSQTAEAWEAYGSALPAMEVAGRALNRISQVALMSRIDPLL